MGDPQPIFEAKSSIIDDPSVGGGLLGPGVVLPGLPDFDSPYPPVPSASGAYQVASEVPPAPAPSPISYNRSAPPARVVQYVTQDPRINSTRKSFHFRSFLLTLGLYSSVIAAIVIAALQIESSATASYVCVGIFPSLYFLEALCCNTTIEFLKHMTSSGGAWLFAARLRAAAPHVVFRLQMYHYETHRHVTTRKGKTTTRTETRRVNTYSETEDFRYEQWRDSSAEFPFIWLYRATKLRFSKSLEFADEYTRTAFNSGLANLVARNRYRDTHYDINWSLEVAGFEPYLLAFTNPEDRPAWMTYSYYLLCTLFTASWLFRFMMEYACVEAEYRLVKYIACAPPLQQAFLVVQQPLAPIAYATPVYGAPAYGAPAYAPTGYPQEAQMQGPPLALPYPTGQAGAAGVTGYSVAENPINTLPAGDYNYPSAPPPLPQPYSAQYSAHSSATVSEHSEKDPTTI